MKKRGRKSSFFIGFAVSFFELALASTFSTEDSTSLVIDFLANRNIPPIARIIASVIINDLKAFMVMILSQIF